MSCPLLQKQGLRCSHLHTPSQPKKIEPNAALFSLATRLRVRTPESFCAAKARAVRWATCNINVFTYLYKRAREQACLRHPSSPAEHKHFRTLYFGARVVYIFINSTMSDVVKSIT